MSAHTGGARRLLHLAGQLGYEFVRRSGGTHLLLRHPKTGEFRCIPATVADMGRNFTNYRIALLQGAGLDKRGKPAVEGERRPRARAEGPATVREWLAARAAEAVITRQQRSSARELDRLAFFDRLMRRR